jgi:hypothetical protein
MDSEALKSHLLQSNEEFRSLSATHQELDARLSELSHRPHLSEHEQVEEAQIKKRKLQLKDRMEDIVRRHKTISA